MDNALDYLVLALYFAVMGGAGYWGCGARSTEDYPVAGRRLGYPLYVGTLSAAAWEQRMSDGVGNTEERG